MSEKNNYSLSILIFLYALVFYFIFILYWREPLEKNVKIITESRCSCLTPDLKKKFLPHPLPMTCLVACTPCHCLTERL